jgi:hypothetical protein
VQAYETRCKQCLKSPCAAAPGRRALHRKSNLPIRTYMHAQRNQPLPNLCDISTRRCKNALNPHTQPSPPLCANTRKVEPFVRPLSSDGSFHVGGRLGRCARGGGKGEGGLHKHHELMDRQRSFLSPKSVVQLAQHPCPSLLHAAWASCAYRRHSMCRSSAIVPHPSHIQQANSQDLQKQHPVFFEEGHC